MIHRHGILLSLAVFRISGGLGTETSGEVVGRMLKVMRKDGIEPGPFFVGYAESTKAMHDLEEHILQGDKELNSETAAEKMAESEKALAWQLAIVELLQEIPSAGIATMPEPDVMRLFTRAGLLAEGIDWHLSERMRHMLASDFVKVLRVFEHTWKETIKEKKEARKKNEREEL